MHLTLFANLLCSLKLFYILIHCLCYFTKKQPLNLCCPRLIFVASICCAAILRLLVLTLYVTLFHLLWNHIFQNTHISGTVLLTQDKPIATLTTLTIHYWSCSNDALPLNKFCNKCTSVKTNSIAKVVFLFASFIFIFLL